MKRIEDNLRDFWDNIKCTSIQIIGVLEEEEKEKSFKKISEHYSWKFSQHGKGNSQSSPLSTEFHTG